MRFQGGRGLPPLQRLPLDGEAVERSETDEVKVQSPPHPPLTRSPFPIKGKAYEGRRINHNPTRMGRAVSYVRE